MVQKEIRQGSFNHYEDISRKKETRFHSFAHRKQHKIDRDKATKTLFWRCRLGEAQSIRRCHGRVFRDEQKL